MMDILLAMTLIHNSPGGMVYPPDCCGGHDCAPISKQEILPTGDRLITNSLGLVATFPKGFKIRPSTDGQSHACISISSKQPLCLFLPGEV